jgi:hypothetical protein
MCTSKQYEDGRQSTRHREIEIFFALSLQCPDGTHTESQSLTERGRPKVAVPTVTRMIRMAPSGCLTGHSDSESDRNNRAVGGGPTRFRGRLLRVTGSGTVPEPDLRRSESESLAVSTESRLLSCRGQPPSSDALPASVPASPSRRSRIQRP